jgi:hypothetical protein
LCMSHLAAAYMGHVVVVEATAIGGHQLVTEPAPRLSVGSTGYDTYLISR